MQKDEYGQYPHHPEKIDKSTYHIVYKRSDINTITIVQILAALSHELYDYNVASEEDFDNYYEAVDYAKDLAKRNKKNLDIKDNYLY